MSEKPEKDDFFDEMLDKEPSEDNPALETEEVDFEEKLEEMAGGEDTEVDEGEDEEAEEGNEKAEEKAEEAPAEKSKPKKGKKPRKAKKEAEEDKAEELIDSPHEAIESDDMVDEELNDLLDDEDLDLDRDQIKEKLLEKAKVESEAGKPAPLCAVPLKFLGEEKEKKVFIGRSKSVYQKYGFEGALHVGRVGETEHFNDDVYMDSLNPHVVFVCGARGSGKSYVLGVMAEELARQNKNVGIVVVDPIGVFWSMKYPNKEEKEIKILGEWGLEPDGLDNLKVFVPKGYADKIPESTYDATFAVQPSLLTGEDWCLTFGIDRFSPTGLMMEKALRKVETGYKTEEGRVIPGRKKNYSLDDLIQCFETDSELNSRDKGFKQDSVRALVSRFDAAKSWGILDQKGTPLSELSKENQLAVIDTSFLDDAVTALVIGLLARRLLAARKICTRKEAASKIKSLKVDEIVEMDVPPTWLFIDEAHTLIPSGNIKTPATEAIVEYVKQGRRPGLSLAFATQQPSAIDSRVLSQLDIVMSHKLVFDDDVKAVFKRTPTIIPNKYKKMTFIKTLPVGVAMTADRREESSRAFIMKIRPRLSQHEGRDAVTLKQDFDLTADQAEKLIVDLTANKVDREEKIKKKDLEAYVNSLNKKYNAKVKLEKVLERLAGKGFVVEENKVSVARIIEAEPLAKPDEALEGESAQLREREPLEPTEEGYVEQTELMAFPIRHTKEDARQLANKHRRKKLLGFLGKEELIQDIQLRYRPVWKVQLDYFIKKNEFVTRDCFIDSVTGEFLHYSNGKFVESKGLTRIAELHEEEVKVLRRVTKKKQPVKEIASALEMDQEKAKKMLEKFVGKGFVRKDLDNDGKEIVFSLNSDIDLPSSPKNEMMESLKRLPFVHVAALAKEREVYSKDAVNKMLNLLWPQSIIRKTSEVFWPVYSITLNLEGSQRAISFDALTGQRIN